MKPQTKQTITLETIIEAFDKYTVPKARQILYDRISARLLFSETVEKKITRHEHLKLFVLPDEIPAGKTIMIFAEFTDAAEAEKIHAAKIRKGSKMAIAGGFCTVGYCAPTMENCRLKVN